MKTKVWYLLTNVFVVVVLVAVLAVKVSAKEAPKVKVVPFDTESAVISIDNATKAFTQLSIENEAGDMLFYNEGAISSSEYSKAFNFKNLRNGAYRVVVKNGATETSVNFKIENGKIAVEESATASLPYIEYKNDILKFSLLNEGSKKVVFSLSDESGTIFTKNLGNEFGISTGFNLNKLEPGNYTVIVSAGDKTFNYNIVK